MQLHISETPTCYHTIGTEEKQQVYRKEIMQWKKYSAHLMTSITNKIPIHITLEIDESVENLTEESNIVVASTTMEITLTGKVPIVIPHVVRLLVQEQSRTEDPSSGRHPRGKPVKQSS